MASWAVRRGVMGECLVLGWQDYPRSTEQATENESRPATNRGRIGDNIRDRPLAFSASSVCPIHPKHLHRSSMVPITQTQQFFTGWQAAQPFESENDAHVARMEAFFDAWKRSVPAGASSNPAEAFHCQQFAEFSAAFSPACQDYRRTGVRANAWRAAGVGKDEMRNSAVLRWLLDGFEDHGQGAAILVAILRQLKRTDLAELASVHPYWTRVEACPFGEQESRIDIEIESPRFLIFIEVKVRATETGNQLERYLDLAAAKAAAEQKPSALIFLTPTGRHAVSEKLREKIIPFSWKQLARILDEHVRKEGLSNTTAGTLLLQYAEHVRTLR
ncbi:PD-(D/E)XK nuclease family protein [Zoogloea sp.]|uniref:PD-(D/E)XK nuclease family protein n=1 Tax=Zoogloea sp. TaxID=49181 RepID=UPI0025FEED09|nr:PD-(D/E)XK nuclease family protein [Zoogloea sp.]